MKLSAHAFALVLLCLALGCASGGAKIESTIAPGVDIPAYATFGWQPAGDSTGAPQSILDAHLKSAIRAQLVEKGYREAAETPDFRVGFETAAYFAEKVSNPVRIGVGVGSWGGHVGGGVSGSVPVGREGVVTTQEIQLSIRAVDPRQNQEVWVGTTAGALQQGSDAETIQREVARVMEEFPARRK